MWLSQLVSRLIAVVAGSTPNGPKIKELFCENSTGGMMNRLLTLFAVLANNVCS